MLKHKVEVKIRLRKDEKSWDERKVQATFEVHAEETVTGAVWMTGEAPDKVRLTTAVRLLGKAIEPEGVEVRWNFEGVPQGHYMDID